MLDLVVTYVNPKEEGWLNEYKIFHPSYSQAESSRFRDWGFLKYWFRGVAQNMPFINNLFFVVSNKKQVPSWVNEKYLKIIEHKDIIPPEILPTFNSVTIEMHLDKIKDLSEKFIYSNDDFFAIGPMSEEDFFDGERPLIVFNSLNLLDKPSVWQEAMLRNCKELAKFYGKKIDATNFPMPAHFMMPLKKETMKEVNSLMKDSLYSSFSHKDRHSVTDVTPYLYLWNEMFQGGIHANSLRCKYFSGRKENDFLVEDFSNLQQICINDTDWDHLEYLKAKQDLIVRFEHMFPGKCKYEK